MSQRLAFCIPDIVVDTAARKKILYASHTYVCTVKVVCNFKVTSEVHISPFINILQFWMTLIHIGGMQDYIAYSLAWSDVRLHLAHSCSVGSFTV